jgi:hypothetical protein
LCCGQIEGIVLVVVVLVPHLASCMATTIPPPRISEGLVYVKTFSGLCSEDTVCSCAALFSEHYAVWADKNKGRVTLSPARLRSFYLFDQRCGVVTATKDGQLVGHSFFAHFDIQGNDCVWITQLVVHRNFRNKVVLSSSSLCPSLICCPSLIFQQGIANELVHLSLCSGWRYAGIVSSNPWAVKAFANATRCANLLPSSALLAKVMPHTNVPYLRNAKYVVDGTQSLVDTHFNISHAEVEPFIRDVSQSGTWQLGHSLPPEHEFLALVQHPHE